jgi:PAS domain S-box-containing protein
MAIILILDDRATNRNIYARLATAIEDGVSVEVFADPLDALEWLEDNRVDLVITDYKMPGMDGAEFTRKFRAIPGGLHVPVVVITAYDDRSFKLRALDAGATDFLQSPIDHFELVTRARNLLALGRQAPAGEEGALPEAPAGRDTASEPKELTGPEGLSRILEAIPALISLADRDGRCLYANAAFAAEVGVQPAALPGSSIAQLLGPERGERSRLADLSVFGSGEALPAYQEEVAGRTNECRCWLTTKAPLRDANGAIAAVLTISFEVTGTMPQGPGQSLPGAR